MYPAAAFQKSWVTSDLLIPQMASFDTTPEEQPYRTQHAAAAGKHQLHGAGLWAKALLSLHRHCGELTAGIPQERALGATDVADNASNRRVRDAGLLATTLSLRSKD